MDNEGTGKVRLFKRDELNIAVTKMVIEIYPSPDDTYIGYWYLDMPHEDQEEVDLAEIEALMDSVFAAGYQLEKLIHMIEYQNRNDADEDSEEDDEL